MAGVKRIDWPAWAVVTAGFGVYAYFWWGLFA